MITVKPLIAGRCWKPNPHHECMKRCLKQRYTIFIALALRRAYHQIAVTKQACAKLYHSCTTSFAVTNSVAYFNVLLGTFAYIDVSPCAE